MLGHACSEQFLGDASYVTHVSTRTVVGKNDAFFRFDVYDDSSFDRIPACDYVINCIGLIKQDPNARPRYMHEVNGTFVNKLADWCSTNNARLIHISTDSVFSGEKGLYTEDDVPDPVDDYGRSKLAGELWASSFMCIRTSTIGEEVRGKRCILEWLKSQSVAEKPVNGFINQYWNGMTAKEYARMCDRIIKNDLYVRGVRHVYSNVMSKHELIVELNKAFKLNLTINPVMLEKKIDRTLITVHDTNRKLCIPSLAEMIKQLP